MLSLAGAPPLALYQVPWPSGTPVRKKDVRNYVQNTELEV